MARSQNLSASLKKRARRQKWLPLLIKFLAELRIQSKEVSSFDDERGGAALELWDSQKMFLETLCDGLEDGIHEFYFLKSRQLGLCVDPDTRVLTADLRWVKIADLLPGDEIVGVDEYPLQKGKGQHRKMRAATVVGMRRSRLPAYRIDLDDGRSLICTAEHPWLSRGRGGNSTSWQAIARPGMKRLKIGASIRWITKPWDDGDFEDGWFGGMLDGEGSIANKNRAGASVNVSQRLGPVWDRLQLYALNRGYHPIVEPDDKPRESKFGKQPVPKLCFNRMDEVFRLIGQTRPTRFLSTRFWEDRELPGKKSGVGWATVTKISMLGEREMVDLQTSTGTYIAEGFVSHNTTVGLAIVLFWMAVHPGMIGCIVADDDANSAGFREQLTKIMESFPEDFIGDDFAITTNNRHFLAFSNNSRLDFLVAGKHKTSWAESKGYALAWLSEVSKYGRQEGIDSFKETLAQTNPERLFIFESTANGFANAWHDMWLAAGEDPYTKRRRFIGWWAKPANSISKKDPRFRIYGREIEMGGDETKLIQQVEEQYGHVVTMEQLAWYRWRQADKSSAEGSLDTHQPWTEQQAFVQPGFSFFRMPQIEKYYNAIVEDPTPFKGYRFILGTKIFETRMEQIRDAAQLELVDLRVWEEPKNDAVYAIGCDPAYGRNEWKDRHAISIWRCFADKMVQVAEYATSEVETHHCAWTLAYLSGAYRNSVMNLELTGPGRAILRELENCREQINSDLYARRTRELEWEDFLGQARWFLYHRYDSFGGGLARGFETTWRSKTEIMNQLRDTFSADMLLIRSLPLLEEMGTITQTREDIGPSAPGRHKDDRVFSLALANRAWIDSLRSSLLQNGASYDSIIANETGEMTATQQQIKRMVFDFFRTAEERAQEEYVPSWLQDQGLV